jgi:ARG and Rhodanese-Phosphatase-superfamily-associated Protein domain
MIQELLQLGDPVEHRGIVIVPLFPRCDAVAEYITLDEALPRGFRVTEASDAGLVPELLVENPLTEDVLLYDGEEVVGAKQNRILNVTVLVEARSELPIPVSCVEEGRWHAQSAEFAAASHTANPRVRRRKAEALQAQPLARGVAQADVWDEVALTADRLEVTSRTGANADAFQMHRGSLSRLEQAFPIQPGQCGAVLALGGDLCLDLVSRPDAFAQLWPKLRSGYLLDALDRLDRPAASPDAVAGFLASVSDAAAARRPSAGRGDDVRLTGGSILGSGLELDGELVQLSAFSADGGRGRQLGRITRPSRRRPA